MSISPDFWTLLIAALTLGILVWTVLMMRAARRSEVFMRCAKRYDGLIDWKRETDSKIRTGEIYDPQHALDQYYRQYWNLQYNQLKQWREGFIDHDTFYFWMRSRYMEFNEATPEGAEFRSYWHRVKGSFDGRFVRLMYLVFNNRLDEAVRERYGRWRLRRYGLKRYRKTLAERSWEEVMPTYHEAGV